MRSPTIHADADGLDLIGADIAREAAILEGAVPALRAAATEIAGAIGSAPSRVYLIGCGDSLDGGLAARHTWERLVPAAVEAVPAMTFATSIVDGAPEGSLVVALSQSGKVSRVIEGVRAARARGLITVTITANPASPLAQEPTDHRWTMDFEKIGAVPGTTSHLMGAAAIYELGFAFADDPELAASARAEMDRLGGLVSVTQDATSEPAAEHAALMARELPVLLLGYGPVLSSARFTVRKLLELTQLIAMWQETEEYAHDEYSMVESRFRVMQFAPPDRGLGRSVEVAHYLQRLGVHLAVVTSEDVAARFAPFADIVYPVPETPPALVPLVYSVPGQTLSLEAARFVGGSLYGMAERIHREDGDPQIYESEIAT